MADGVQVGDVVTILGYPLRLATFTSSRGTFTDSQPGWRQADAAATPGNSGGPALSVLGGGVGLATKRASSEAGTGSDDANLPVDGAQARQMIDDWIDGH